MRENAGPAPHSGQGHNNGSKAIPFMLQLFATAVYFMCERGVCYVRHVIDGLERDLKLDSADTRHYIAQVYRTACGSVPSIQDMESAVRSLVGTCTFGNNPTYPLSLRVAEDEHHLYYDLGEKQNIQAVQISGGKWSIAPAPRPVFRRYTVNHPQVRPDASVTGYKDLHRLTKYTNFEKHSEFMLYCAWLVASFFPNYAHPIMWFVGVPGSAKSTAARLTQRILDPQLPELMTPSSDLTGLNQILDHRWLTIWDNLSRVPHWMPDALCRACTGTGSSKRVHYTNDDDFACQFRRLILITSVGQIFRQPDLLDRTIQLRLRPIDAENRRSEAALLAEFEADRPIILAALLNLVAVVHARLPEVRTTNLPRLSDFGRILIALDDITQGTQFMDAYDHNMRRLGVHELASDPVFRSLKGWHASHASSATADWSGPPTRLFDVLTAYADAVSIPRDARWPSNPQVLTKRLNRLSAELRSAGIEVESSRTGEQRTITLRSIGSAAVKAVVRDRVASASDNDGDGIPASALDGARGARTADVRPAPEVVAGCQTSQVTAEEAVEGERRIQEVTQKQSGVSTPETVSVADQDELELIDL